MLDNALRTLPNLKDMPQEAWLGAIDDFGEEEGYFEPVGEEHFAVLLDRAPTLIVSFETIEGARARPAHALPLGHEISQTTGWSSLCLMARSPTWFRDSAVYGYFDRLVDDGFFEDFDRVVFYGEGMCGYAAAAYSVAAPGAAVLALSPQATLDPREAEWDTRFTRQRRRNFTDRYGYAPDMLEAAERAFILYDPEEELDAMHAALFRGGNITRMRCRGYGPGLEATLEEMGILEPMLIAAGRGALTAPQLSRFLRNRRMHRAYLRRLCRRLEDDGRERLALMLCRNVCERLDSPPFFCERAEALEALLAGREGNLR